MHRAYDVYQFRAAHQAIFNFCNDTLSAVYLAAVKDRLYCDALGSERRRRCQTVPSWGPAGILPPAPPHLPECPVIGS